MDIISKLTHSLSPGGEACYSLSVPSSSPPLLFLLFFFFQHPSFHPSLPVFRSSLSCPSLFNCTLARSLALSPFLLSFYHLLPWYPPLLCQFIFYTFKYPSPPSIFSPLQFSVFCSTAHIPPFCFDFYWCLHSEIYRHVCSYKGWRPAQRRSLLIVGDEYVQALLVDHKNVDVDISFSFRA